MTWPEAGNVINVLGRLAGNAATLPSKSTRWLEKGLSHSDPATIKKRFAACARLREPHSGGETILCQRTTGSAFGRDKPAIYDALVDVAVAVGDAQLAWRFAEFSRAREFLSAIHRGAVEPLGADPAVKRMAVLSSPTYRRSAQR